MIWTGHDCRCGNPIVTDRNRHWCSVCALKYLPNGELNAPGRALVELLDEALYGPRGITR